MGMEEVEQAKREHEQSVAFLEQITEMVKSGDARLADYEINDNLNQYEYGRTMGCHIERLPFMQTVEVIVKLERLTVQAPLERKVLSARNEP